MELTSIFIALILLALGVVVLSYFLWLLVMPSARSIRNQREMSRYKRFAEKIPQVDILIEEKRFPDALKLLRQTPLLDVCSKSELQELIREHHQNILSRCLVISEELGTRPDNLAEVERLVLERGELELLYIRAQESFLSLKSRREKAGKEIPTWSKSDFDVRLAEIQKELENNRAVLAAAFEKLFRSIESSRKEADIVYH